MDFFTANFAEIIFYCQGPTCDLSAKSALKAEKLGYTNLKVYEAGIALCIGTCFSLISNALAAAKSAVNRIAPGLSLLSSFFSQPAFFPIRSRW